MKVFLPVLVTFVGLGFLSMQFWSNAASRTINRPQVKAEAGDEVVASNLVFVEQGEWQDPVEEKLITYLDLDIEDRLYYLKLNHPWNTLTVYTEYYPGSGEFDQPVEAFAVSVGTGEKTELGIYQLDARDPDYVLHPMFGNCWTQYDRRFDSDKLTHSETYDVPKGGIPENFDYGSMHTSAFNKIGDAASSGCIRLRTGDAAWIYYNVQDHATLEIYSDLSSPGPLGKPVVQRITDACPVPYRNWDPTDPHPENPWHEATEAELALWLEDAEYKPIKGVPISITEAESEAEEENTDEVQENPISLRLNSSDGILHLPVAPTYEQIKSNFICEYVSEEDLVNEWQSMIGRGAPGEWNLYFEGDHNLEEPGVYTVSAYAMDVKTEIVSKEIAVTISVE